MVRAGDMRHRVTKAQLIRENKKLRQLWAAVQAYMLDDTDGQIEKWKKIEAIVADLNRGKF